MFCIYTVSHSNCNRFHNTISIKPFVVGSWNQTQNFLWNWKNDNRIYDSRNKSDKSGNKNDLKIGMMSLHGNKRSAKMAAFEAKSVLEILLCVASLSIYSSLESVIRLAAITYSKCDKIKNRIYIHKKNIHQWPNFGLIQL